MTRCVRCGLSFNCSPRGDCWCKNEPPRRRNDDVKGCFCPSCFALLDAEKPGFGEEKGGAAAL